MGVRVQFSLHLKGPLPVELLGVGVEKLPHASKISRVLKRSGHLGQKKMKGNYSIIGTAIQFSV